MIQKNKNDNKWKNNAEFVFRWRMNEGGASHQLNLPVLSMYRIN